MQNKAGNKMSFNRLNKCMGVDMISPNSMPGAAT